ncbi:hypothetical protein AB685_10425 [Bacillus sp. LL01]|uniref:prenyltransferase/squalene oxidase repeat-containing protein n=1 Tax=Bacillus sp. LL01 TaxID=1665556 RepID=UPI00064CF472|nr:prenyltransferase/squalene oxidase repeat-containing protein [Bacillus sp. LL01]KMJ58315.1 hypothetical protein AB685_10425 [Bacillus sp. LL01]
MTINLKKARDFIYLNGALWEKALYRHLFEGGPISHFHNALKSYKNDDNGFGHGFEYDIKCPDSHPLALEFMLGVFRDTGLPVGDVFEGAAEWVERNQNEDGTLVNPATILHYPYSPWWGGGGQTIPASITGNLLLHGLCTEQVAFYTSKWVKENLNDEQIQKTEWLFMNYHAVDYYTNVEQTEENLALKEAAIKQVIKCAEAVPEKQYFTFFQFAPMPDSAVAKATPKPLMEKFLNYLEASQREDGGWDDEHGLSYWQPYFTIVILNALRNYGRL